MKFLGLYTAGYEEKFVLENLRAVLRRFGTYELFDSDRSQPPSDDVLVEKLAQADVVLTGWPTPVFPEALLKTPHSRLKYICHLAGQVSPFLSRKFIDAGLLVTNWGQAGVWTFAEGNIALIYACLKDMHRIGRHMKNPPQWGYSFPHPTPTLRDKRVGMVGFGAIARLLVEMLRPFKCEVLVFDPYLKDPPPGITQCSSLEGLFSQSDIVSVQCGLTPQTVGLIGMEQLRLLRPHAIFINTARGKIVREAELVEFLARRPDVMAGLDVYETEPLPADSPLPHMDNVICYPHCIGTGGEVFDREISHSAAENICAYCTGGQVKNIITAEMYDRMT